MERRQILIASNRGPVSFGRDEEGRIVAGRGSGGLVTALTGALGAAGGLWVASAMTDEDRERAAEGPIEVESGTRVRLLEFDPEVYERYYNGISNRMLWFLHHLLWDLPREPVFDRETVRAWGAYRRVNEGFADALLEEAAGLGSAPAFLLQDYHLSLAPALLRRREPGAMVAHFSHIPFAGPAYVRVLPDGVRRELLEGLLGADLLGFQAPRWAENFLLSCRDLPGAEVDLAASTVRFAGREVRVRVYPISVDADAMQAQASSRSVARAMARISGRLGEARLLLRVDRTELTKNVLRGLHAYELFLDRHPEWRRRIVHLALLNPSREAIPEYRAYTRECVRLAGRINERLGEDGWQPVELRVRDDFPSVLAAYRLYDVLLVNPVFDGMNLVAKEGPLLNERGGVLILSTNAGAAQELGEHALVVNPFDVAATADAIAEALTMDRDERARRAEGLRAAVRANELAGWVQAQLRDLEEARS